MSIKLRTASDGLVILQPEDTASEVTVTVPAGTSDLVSTDTLRTELNATGSAPIYACRAWVNFNGTGTVSILGSANVSSITDIGVGRYIVNFTTAMPNGNYSAVASNANRDGGVFNPITTSVGVFSGESAIDSTTVTLAIFG